MNIFSLANLLSGLGIELSDKKLDQLDQFLKILLEANRTVNLSSITNYPEAIIKHLYDSLVVMTMPAYQRALLIIDVGSGGGIPGLPLAICSPEKKITSLDSTKKKIDFQIGACHKLKLENLCPVWGRAEELARQAAYREKYDLALARAVAPVNILAELTIPFVKVNGSIIFYKSKNAANELSKGWNAIEVLGGQVRETIAFELPYNLGSRVLIHIQKTTATANTYPRKTGTPQKKPL